MLRVTAKADLRGIKKKIMQKEKATQLVSQRALRDSNRFVPKDTGALEASSLSASQLSKGLLVWDTPYARRLYWNPQYNFARDRNPNARGLWFEAAKSMYLSDWLKAAKGAY